MLKANREPKDFAGWSVFLFSSNERIGTSPLTNVFLLLLFLFLYRFAAYTEWKVLYMLCKDKDGLLPKEKIKGVYDGSIFQQLENDRLEKTRK